MYIIYNRKVLVYRDYEFYEFHVTMNFGREFHRPRLAQHTSNLIASVITCSPHKKPARWRWRWWPIEERVSSREHDGIRFSLLLRTFCCVFFNLTPAVSKMMSTLWQKNNTHERRKKNSNDGVPHSYLIDKSVSLMDARASLSWTVYIRVHLLDDSSWHAITMFNIYIKTLCLICT